MATWTAVTKSPLSKPVNGYTVTLVVDYYAATDVTRTTLLHSHQFEWPAAASTTPAAMQADIIDEGTRARATNDRIATINANFPVGTTVNVP